jgi:hypothetical protein
MDPLVTVMSRLSFGALLKAKRTLAQQPSESGSSDAPTNDEESAGEEVQTHGGFGGQDPSQDEWKERKPKERRANKHA